MKLLKSNTKFRMESTPRQLVSTRFHTKSTPRWLRELWGYHSHGSKPVTMPKYKFMEKYLDKEEDTR